ncbi:MAG TPA: lysine 2,3-aminomutase, partial [Thermoanaerobacterales bacterium]|nr:lysine 2,3-aminomutase [Thermoanaerobacterales bacterium]
VGTAKPDAPGGGGKIPIMPQYLISQSDRKVILRNYEGVICVYTEPEDDRSVYPEKRKYYDETPDEFKNIGLAPLFDGKEVSIEPADLQRVKRRK